MDAHEPAAAPSDVPDDALRPAPIGAAAPRPPGTGEAVPGPVDDVRGQDSRSWQDELRSHADAASAGSDEAADNTLEPSPGAGTGLHGGLVR